MATSTAIERLTRALEQAGAPGEMVERARSGQYDEWHSPHASPISRLIADAMAVGLDGIARQAGRGEFDWSTEELAEAARTSKGQNLLGAMLEIPE